MRILGREPALWLGLIGAAVQLFSALLIPLSADQQGALNAVAVAIIGLLTALAVSAEKAVPALVGAAQAVLALGLAFGWDLDADTQSTIMAFVAATAAMFVRTQVVAPVPGPSQTRAVA